MGCNMISVRRRKLKKASETTNPYLRYATPEQRKWLKTHSLSDLEEIADQLEFQGENVYNMRQVIDDLYTVAANLGFVISRHPEYDLIEFVRAEEKATA